MITPSYRKAAAADMTYREYRSIYIPGPGPIKARAAAPAENKLRRWEAAALIALSLALSLGAWAQGRQMELASRLVRLHVVAADDSPLEQEIKLQVRDRVLELMSPALSQAESQEQARAILEDSLPAIEVAAREASQGRQVELSLTRELYPTKSYEGFSLPAGRYWSLKISLGQARGQNWWCIVFPPVCLTAAQGELIEEQLGEEGYRLISEDGRDLRFKTLELWGELLAWLEEEGDT